MATSRRFRLRPKPHQRRALVLLAGSSEGVTEAVMLAHGFTVAQMAELVRAGLASAAPERITMGSKAIEVARVRITDEGRKALENWKIEAVETGLGADGRSSILSDCHR